MKIGKLTKKEVSNALNEVRILASIYHNNVIAYKEAFYDESSSSLCIIMEYADDKDLYQKIMEQQKLKRPFDEDFIWYKF